MTLRPWPCLAVLVTLAGPLAAQAAQPLDSTLLAGFRWRNIGPANMGGRTSSVVGIPSPAKTLFIAGAAGGIWKTTNAGITFRPAFDNQRCIATGELAIAPTETPQDGAGAGEADPRNTSPPGG